jgi:lysozyme
MRTSDEGISLIRHFEGCRLDAYLCPAGVWTIGYGHTRNVKQGDVIDQEQAEAFIIEDLEEFEGYVGKLVEIGLKQNEFDALVSWTFNLGPKNLEESTLLNRINYGLLCDVPTQIKRWNRAGGKVLQGLVKRRKAEALLWEGKDWRLYESD